MSENVKKLSVNVSKNKIQLFYWMKTMQTATILVRIT